MARTKYCLFVDEVKATPPFTFYNYTGVVLKDNDFKVFQTELDLLKDDCISRLGGSGVNLHFSPLIKKKKQFASLTKQEEEKLWIELLDLFNKTDYHILSGLVSSDKHKEYYPNFRVNIATLAFKTLLQNFARYLYLNNGYGSIIIESSNDNDKLIEEFYRTKIAGSKYITSEGYNQVLRGIKFENKDKLNQGLQLADFMANPISRLVSGLNQYKNNKIPKESYENLLNAKIFSGMTNDIYEFGVKKILF